MEIDSESSTDRAKRILEILTTQGYLKGSTVAGQPAHSITDEGISAFGMLAAIIPIPIFLMAARMRGL